MPYLGLLVIATQLCMPRNPLDHPECNCPEKCTHAVLVETVYANIFTLNLEPVSSLRRHVLISHYHDPNVRVFCQVDRPLVAVSENGSRFRARAGDFYQCESDRYIVLSTPGPSNASTNLSIPLYQRVHVILTTRDLRLQSFSDFNLNEFSGAGKLISRYPIMLNA